MSFKFHCLGITGVLHLCSLFADRLSTETMRSNQLRLYLSSMAYVLVL